MTPPSTLRTGRRSAADDGPSPTAAGPRSARVVTPPALAVPLTAATALTVAGLYAHGAEPLSGWNEAYPHVPGHLVSGGVALLVGAAAATLARSTARRGARRAVLALAAAWALLAGARGLEAVGGAVGDGSGENLVHTAGVLLLGPSLAAVVLAHVAVLLVRGVALPWSVRAGVAVTPVAWFGLEEAGSGAFLLLAVAAAAAWLVAGLLVGAATAADGRGAAVVPLGSTVAGGLLWMLYGVLELLQPWGPDTRYDDALRYDVVVDPVLFVAYSVPGALALTLSGVGLVAVARRLGVSSRTAGVAAVTAAALGVVSAVGVLLRLDPLFTGPRILGTVVLAGGVLVTAMAAPRRARLPLALLGMLGLGLLPVWPLVYAVGWLPAGGAAGVLVAHGAGWVAVGLCLPVSVPRTGVTSTDRAAVTATAGGRS